MTPHTPSPVEPDGSDHPDVEVLADLAEGLADPADEPALRAHLAGCAECADTFEALADVRDLLGTFEPPAMPEDVARRIDAALAAAAGTPRTATAPPEPAPPLRGRPGTEAPDAPRTPAGPPRGPSGGTGPGRPPRRRRRRIVLAAATAVVALGLGALLLPRSPDHSAGTAASAAARSGPSGGSIQYQDDRLAAQAQELVRAAGPGPADQPHAVTQQQPAQPRTGGPATAGTAPGTAATAPACAAGTTGVTDRSPLAVGPGSYHGTAALALVYPVAGHPDRLDVYLITPDCGAPGVLLHRTVPSS